MTIIALYGGPTKKSLIERAFGMCGQSSTEFELTPEEYTLGLRCMNDIAGTLGTIPFNMPAGGDGNAEDESGIERSDVLGFTVRLAEELANNIGKQFQVKGSQASAKSALLAKYQPIPRMQLGRNTPRGFGAFPGSGPRPHFRAPVSDSEPRQ